MIVFGEKKESAVRAEKIEPDRLRPERFRAQPSLMRCRPAFPKLLPARRISRPRRRLPDCFRGQYARSLDPAARCVRRLEARDWIEYRGKLGSDGKVRAEEARLSPNVVSKAEAYARSSLVHVAAIADPLQPDKIVLKYVSLDNPAPLFYTNPAMQARVDGILNSLIPPFQSNSHDDDPRKIKFRVELTADKKWNRVTPLPSGVILIPHQVVELLNNDSQLAAVLADAIAFTIENEAFRMRGVVPGVALASFASSTPSPHPSSRGARQTSRNRKSSGYVMSKAIVSVLACCAMPDTTSIRPLLLGGSWLQECPDPSTGLRCLSAPRTSIASSVRSGTVLAHSNRISGSLRPTPPREYAPAASGSNLRPSALQP